VLSPIACKKQIKEKKNKLYPLKLFSLYHELPQLLSSFAFEVNKIVTSRENFINPNSMSQ
jgi:hypothetical protein